MTAKIEVENGIEWLSYRGDEVSEKRCLFSDSLPTSDNGSGDFTDNIIETCRDLLHNKGWDVEYINVYICGEFMGSYEASNDKFYKEA